MSKQEDIFLYEEVPKSSRLVIMFSAASEKRFTGYKTLQHVPVNRLFVRDPKQSWFNGPIQKWWNNADGLLEKLSTITQRFDPANIICMGSSMGGYAAILFGCKLNVGKVAAFSPQMILDSRLPNNPGPSHKIQYKNLYDVIENANGTSIDILFGSEDICDVYNIIDAKKHNKINLQNIYGAAHNLMQYLLDHGVLTKIIEEYAFFGKMGTSLPLSYLHQDVYITSLVREAVEAFYFHSPKAAIPALNKLVQYAPQWPAAHCWLGMARAKNNDLSGAVENFRNAISRLTQDETPYVELAIILTKLGKHQDAESVLVHSMQFAAQPSARQLHWLGIIKLKQNKLIEAKEAQMNALRAGMGGGQAQAEYQLGLINMKMKAYTEAVSHFEKSRTLGARNLDLKKHLVTALFHSTTPENFDYARALELCPDHPLLEKRMPIKTDTGAAN